MKDKYKRLIVDNKKSIVLFIRGYKEDIRGYIYITIGHN